MKIGKTSRVIFSSLLVCVIALFFLAPVFVVVNNSFREQYAIVANPLSLPEGLNLANYVEAVDRMGFAKAFLNTFKITMVSLLFILVFAAMLAYFLMRLKNKAASVLYYILVASMLIPFQAMMIPFVGLYGPPGLLNSHGALIFSYAGFGLAFAVFLVYGFLNSIPPSLIESATVDGASEYQIFFRIIFPVIQNILITIFILDALWIWSDFLLPSLVLRDESLRTLQLSMFYFYRTYSTDYGPATAALVLSALPIVLLYLFMQRHIVNGVTQGAVKG
jgi:raffinose/stachyose/melibiose transport system permease protein